ncbi:MAG TPA: hypothetical protein VIH47_10720 [Solirubrobacterales bacterium]
MTQSPPDEHGQGRRVLKPVLIGLFATVVAMAIPLLIVLILAFVAQIIISGH